MKLLKSLKIIALLFLLCSCEDDWLKNCGEGESQLFDVEDLIVKPVRVCVLQNIDEQKKELNMRIDSSEDFNKYLNCSFESSEFEPDFSEYFLLTGKYSHHQCAVLASQSVFVCDGKLVYQVQINQHDCHAFVTVYYGVLVPRKYQDMRVVFDVMLKTKE